MSSELAEIRQNAWRALLRHVDLLVKAAFLERDNREAGIEDEEEKQEREELDDEFEYDVPVLDDLAAEAEQFGQLQDTLQELEDKLKSRDVAAVEQLFDDVQFHCEQLLIPTEAYWWETIAESIDILQLVAPVLLFRAKQPTIIVPQLIVKAQAYLTDIIRRDPKLLFGLTGREFEELIAEIFAKRGFTVELTQATHDGGRDIIAVRKDLDIPTKFIVECKRYAPERKVTLGIVQRLYGVKMAESANKAILATTSGFTGPAVQFAENHLWDLDLKGYDAVVKWIREHGGAY